MGTAARSLKPTVLSYGSSFASRPAVFQQLGGFLARIKPIEPVQLRGGRTVDAAVRVQHIDDRKFVALPDLEVDLVVCRRHLQNARAKLWIDRFVADDWNFLTRQRPPGIFANQIAITFVVWMNRHSSVGHDCLRPRRRNFEITPRLLDNLVTHIIERAFLGRRDDLFVRQRREGDRIPVDHAFTAINQTFVVKIDEHLLDRAHISFIKCITLPRPIRRTPQAFQLFNDDAAVFILPFHHAPEKFFAAEIVPGLLFRPPQMFLHRRLSGHSRMVDAGKPKHFVSAHPRTTREDILNGVVQYMTEGEHARDVRRRHHDGECRLGRMRIRAKVAMLQPARIPFLFNARRIVIFWKFRHRAGIIRASSTIATGVTALAVHICLPPCRCPSIVKLREFCTNRCRISRYRIANTRRRLERSPSARSRLRFFRKRRAVLSIPAIHSRES